MSILITLFIAILPVYLIGLYVYKKDNEKESKKILTKLFLFGMLSCIPAAIIEALIEPIFNITDNSNLIYLFLYVSIGIALVEELCKWFFVYNIGYNNKEFDQVYDILVYSIFVSLGFACFENFFYVFSNDGITTAFFRAITAIPGHASDAIIMGNYLGLAKLAEVNGEKQKSNKYLLFSIMMPTLIHSIYDYCLFSEQFIFIIIFAIFLIFTYIYSIRTIKHLAINNKYLYNKIKQVNYCTNCGTKAIGNYCTKCGMKLR